MVNKTKKRNKIVDVSGKKVEVPEQPLSVSSNGVYGQYLNAGKPSVNVPIYGNMLSGTMSNEQKPTQPVSNTGESTPTQSTETPVDEDNTQNGTYAEGIAASGENSGTITEGKSAPMTYESWINEQKQIEDQKYANALKEAEKYRERASADAQASYLQNMSTYGINAETMAKMGLTGGGYSDYLNSKAYAQQRADMQAAEKNALAMEKQASTTYQDAIAQLNQDSTELAMGESGDTIVMDDIIKSVQNGEFVNETGQPYSWEEIKEMLYRERNNGATVTDEDIEKAKQAYDAWISYKNGKITSDEYYNALNGDTTANEQVSNATIAEAFKAEAKNQVGEMFGYAEGKYDKYNAVSIYSSSYKASDFGKYEGVNNSSSKQYEYIQKIVDDAKAKKIPVGSVVRMNYGVGDVDGSNYMYMGNGVFVELPLTYADAYPKSEGFSTYVPDGYKKNLYGNIRKE